MRVRRWVTGIAIGCAVVAVASVCGAVIRRELAIQRAEDDLGQLWQRTAYQRTAASASFTATVTPSSLDYLAEFAGHGIFSFADPPWSDVSYTRIAAGPGPVTGRELSNGTGHWFRIDRAVPADRREWVEASGTRVDWGGPAQDPRIGLGDPQMWARMLRGVPRSVAGNARTEALPALPGATRRYLFKCYAGQTWCPARFGSQMDVIAGPPTYLKLAIWLGDDGRLRRLDVAGAAGSGRVTYQFSASITIDSYGVILGDVSPPDDEISVSDELKLPGPTSK